MQKKIRILTCATFSFALSLSLLSGVTQAAMYAPPTPSICAGHDVIVACEKTGWRVGVTGLYVQQMSDDPYFIGIEHSAFSGSDGATTIDYFNVNEDYHFGFKLEAAYRWRQGQEFALTWKRISASNDTIIRLPSRAAASSPPPGLVGIGRDSLSDSLITPYDAFFNALVPAAIRDNPTTIVHTPVDFDLNQVNAELAQYVSFGNYVTTRFQFGLSYLRLEHIINQWFSGLPPVLPIEPVSDPRVFDAGAIDESSFNGLGIRTGIHADWNFYRGSLFAVGVMGEINAGLYTGKLKNYLDAVITSPELPSGFGFQHHYQDDATLVPEAETKLGLNVAYLMRYEKRLVLSGGWEAQEIFHVIKHLNTVNNYGHQGPFLQLQYIA